MLNILVFRKREGQDPKVDSIKKYQSINPLRNRGCQSAVEFFVSASVFTRPNTVLASTVKSHIFHHGLRLTVSAMTAYDAHVSPRRPNTAADPSFLDFPLLQLLLFLLMLSAFHISAFRRHHRRRVSAQLRLSPLRRCRSISSSFWSGDLPAEDALQQIDERFHRTGHRGWITMYEEVSRSHAVRD